MSGTEVLKTVFLQGLLKKNGKFRACTVVNIHSLLIRVIKAYLLVAVGVTYSRYPWCYLRLRWWAGLGFGLGWGWGRV